MNIYSSISLNARPSRTASRVGCGFIVLLLLFLLPPVLGVASEPSQELNRAVTVFYNRYVKIRPLGVPQEKELAKFRPYLSMSLRKQLQDANQVEERYQKANRGEVPPLVEGDVFSSLFEGASAFRVLPCEAKAAAGFCLIEFTYIDSRDKSSFRWKDKVYVVREAGRWVVDDVEYLGDWQFMHKGSLTGLLKSVTEEGNKK